MRVKDVPRAPQWAGSQADSADVTNASTNRTSGRLPLLTLLQVKGQRTTARWRRAYKDEAIRLTKIGEQRGSRLIRTSPLVASRGLPGRKCQDEEATSSHWSRNVPGGRHEDSSCVGTTNRSHSTANSRHAVQVSRKSSAGRARRKVSTDQATPAARGLAQRGRNSSR